MMKNKIKLSVAGILMLFLQNCSFNEHVETLTPQTLLSDSSQEKSGVPRVTYFDSLNIYVELKAVVYNIDSIMVNVDIVNDSEDSVWLYKPILPSDTLIEETFYVRREDNNENLPHIVKLTNHRYYDGGQRMLPSIIPVINDSNFLVLLPYTKKTFITNLSKHYNLRDLDRKKIKALFINYGMDFPYVKNQKHVYLKDSNAPDWDKEPKPAYINISIKKRDKDAPPDFDELTKVLLPDD